MPEQRFATIVGSDDPSSLFIVVPAEVVAALSKKKRPPVRVTLNGDYTYRSTVAVYGGRYYLPLRREIREACGLAPGMPVDVTLALDEEPRNVEVPDDLAVAFASDPEARAVFDRLSFTHQREYVEWFTSAKREATRMRRVAQTLEMLHSGVKTPG
ncbi:MAG TPA: YdeI/OmpD-associated family protein [Ktedonobacterales bacterium]|jgi:Bacteriocin-protection, YdeI or OmpD-Associated/Domain of unknown function (DUF1905)|nr:YdeI/OmpD-associated family protein [Ktedonobacterales bacterium]